MNHKLFSMASLMVVLVLTLSFGAGQIQAQTPRPAGTTEPRGTAWPYTFAQPAGQKAPGQAASPQIAMGQPGTSYRYVQTIGVTGTAYISDTLHLNHPNSIFIDSSDNFYTAEEPGY
jgi:hypothetical protein